MYMFPSSGMEVSSKHCLIARCDVHYLSPNKEKFLHLSSDSSLSTAELSIAQRLSAKVIVITNSAWQHIKHLTSNQIQGVEAFKENY